MRPSSGPPPYAPSPGGPAGRRLTPLPTGLRDSTGLIGCLSRMKRSRRGRQFPLRLGGRRREAHQQQRCLYLGPLHQPKRARFWLPSATHLSLLLRGSAQPAVASCGMSPPTSASLRVLHGAPRGPYVVPPYRGGSPPGFHRSASRPPGDITSGTTSGACFPTGPSCPLRVPRSGASLAFGLDVRQPGGVGPHVVSKGGGGRPSE